MWGSKLLFAENFLLAVVKMVSHFQIQSLSVFSETFDVSIIEYAASKGWYLHLFLQVNWFKKFLGFISFTYPHLTIQEQ